MTSSTHSGDVVDLAVYQSSHVTVTSSLRHHQRRQRPALADGGSGDSAADVADPRRATLRRPLLRLLPGVRRPTSTWSAVVLRAVRQGLLLPLAGDLHELHQRESGVEGPTGRSSGRPWKTSERSVASRADTDAELTMSKRTTRNERKVCLHLSVVKFLQPDLASLLTPPLPRGEAAHSIVSLYVYQNNFVTVVFHAGIICNQLLLVQFRNALARVDLTYHLQYRY